MMNNNDEKQVIANVVTSEGEIVDKFYEGDSYKKTSEKQKLYRETHYINFNKGVKYLIMYPEIIEIVSNELKPTEFQFLMKLSKFVEYETCILRTGYGRGCHDMTLKDISDNTGIDYTRVSRLMNSLIKHGLIGEFKTGNKDSNIKKIYVVNPYIYTNGKNPEKCVINHFFKHSGWNELINGNIIYPKELIKNA